MSTLITFFCGIYLAYVSVKIKRGSDLLDGIVTLPLVLPPTVVGFFLLLAFGKNGAIGKFLAVFGAKVVFTWQGAVIAAAVSSLPLMYRTVKGALENFDKNLVYAGQTLGLSELVIFRKIMFPNILPSVIAGTVLAFARSMGEFGATIMLAGNIAGKTQTMSVAVYSAVSGGNRELAFRWAAIVCVISLSCILVMNLIGRLQGAKWR